MQIINVAVIGAGTMGAGIAQVSAQHGYSVCLQDVSTEVLEKARKGIEKSLQKGVDKNKLSQADKDGALERIKTTKDLPEAVNEADLVIEAVFEDLDLKKKIFQQIDENAPGKALIASNTSALPITSMGGVTGRPQQVLGLHFMNPVPLMKGVEVIPGLDTSEEVMEAGLQFAKNLGKDPVKAVDYGGFIVTRILDAMLNEAVYCVMDGNDPAEVDKAMKICTNFPMGPCELIDLAGVDVVYRGLDTLGREFGGRFHIAPLLQKMVRAGHLGRKTGRGFYDYSSEK